MHIMNWKRCRSSLEESIFWTITLRCPHFFPKDSNKQIIMHTINLIYTNNTSAYSNFFTTWYINALTISIVTHRHGFNVSEKRQLFHSLLLSSFSLSLSVTLCQSNVVTGTALSSLSITLSSQRLHWQSQWVGKKLFECHLLCLLPNLKMTSEEVGCMAIDPLPVLILNSGQMHLKPHNQVKQSV